MESFGAGFDIARCVFHDILRPCRHSLRQHMLRHAGKMYKCGLPGCPTTLRTASELKRHRMLVHENIERKYSCPDCSYAGKTKSQLDR